MPRGLKYVIPVAILSGVIILTLGFMWVFGVAFFSSTTADTRGETSVREQTVADGDYRITAYEYFYDKCAAVQANEGRIAALEKELASEPSERREMQINASLTALRAQRSEEIAEYNAEARKEGTTAQFRASDLPALLDPTEKTTCTVN